MNNLVKFVILLIVGFTVLTPSVLSQDLKDTVVVRFTEIDDVLNNPGKGLTTFQRFNGDTLNPGTGWTEGFPIEYQDFDGNFENKDHPQTTIAYFRVYWRFVEPEKGVYRWDIIDKALETARERGQTLMLRVPPYGDDIINDSGKSEDVPDWYREMVGPDTTFTVRKWLVDPEDPRFVRYYGGFIRALGKRYDGHPDLNAVDGAIVSAWGEGEGSELLTPQTRQSLIDAYVESFKKTPLLMLLMDEKSNPYALSKRNTGYRFDCLGDLGFWAEEQNGWTHMYDFYPRYIIEYGVEDVWKKSPVSFEICGTFWRWKHEEGYGKEEVKYIFDQALKWHMSSFNAKSSPVLPEWQPLVDEWLKKMGYRFVLRRFSYNPTIGTSGKLQFTSWWENKGVAPIYKRYPLALRLEDDQHSTILLTDADIRKWLPGDNLYDDSVFLPADLPAGEYELSLALVDPLQELGQEPEPAVQLAIEGRTKEGWYPLGKVTVLDQ